MEGGFEMIRPTNIAPDFWDLFCENVICSETEGGDRIHIDCRRGHWSVEANSLNDALTEALNYFQIYWMSGEY